MAKRYSKEVKEQIVQLHQTGRSVVSLSREFGPSTVTIHKWIRQAVRSGGDLSLREENRRLRKELAKTKESHEILKKAAAWFAQESGVSKTH